MGNVNLLDKTKPAPFPDVIKAEEVNEYATENSKGYIVLKIPTRHPLSYYSREDYTKQVDGSWTCNNICNVPPLTTPISKSYYTLPLSWGTASKCDKTVTETVTEITESLSRQVKAWLEETVTKSGISPWFSLSELYQDFGITEANDKANVRQILVRLERDEHKIERSPRDNTKRRYISLTANRLDYKSAGGRKALALKFPFSIENYANVYSGNLIVLAGSPNAGKTAYVLNFIYFNQNEYPIYYITSELGREELATRLEKFQDIALEDWKFEAEERAMNFADCIRPDDINIIDYLDITQDFFLVADELKKIHARLNSGIALVTLQKNPGNSLGLGGVRGLEKPRLYMSMDDGKLKLVKVKNHAQSGLNPNGMVATFTLTNGCDFRIIRPFHFEDADKE